MTTQPNDPPKPARIRGRFSKGVSGNPKGRPKGSRSITDYVRRWLDGDYEGVSGYEIIAASILKQAAKKPEMMKEIWARIDGPIQPPQAIPDTSGLAAFATALAETVKRTDD
jgi:hypothetical protein